MLTIDYNLLAYEYSKNQFTFKPVLPSGQKEEDALPDKYSPSDDYAVLALEDDIINSDGYGLKKGFYNITTDKYMDFILLSQSGKLKAKIPVVKMEVFETTNPVQDKPKKMSYRQYRNAEEKKRRKYYKGENPLEYNYQNAQIEYIRSEDAYLIIYDINNVQLRGILKF